MARVTVTEFTDPYSTWCWGAEPVVRRLQEVYRDQLRLEYVMGGLAADFSNFHDPANEGDWTEEVVPHWLSASDRHGMPVDVSVWEETPPTSSYPANLAYEAAALQDRTLAHEYLRRLREAAAAVVRPLDREDELVDLAESVGLDANRFRVALDDGSAQEAFDADLRLKREHGVTALPTFLVEVDGETELLRGYRPFASFEKLLTEFADDLQEHEPRPLAAFVDQSTGHVATQEVATVYGLTTDEAFDQLRSLADEGTVEPVEVGTGYLWKST